MTRALLAAAVTVAVALVGAPVARTAAPPVRIETSFAPLVHAFADPVQATVTVAVDGSRVDPATVRVSASFAPYRAGPPRVERRSGSGGVELVAASYRLGCDTRACVPGAAERSFAPAPVLVTWRTRTGRTETASAAWPPLIVASRLTPQDLARPELLARLEPPTPADAVPADVLGPVLIGAGALLAAAGAVALALLARGLRRPAEPTPLERALAFVDETAAGELSERRRALHGLALELERAGLHAEARAARRLAWAPTLPATGPVRELADGIRSRTRDAAFGVGSTEPSGSGSAGLAGSGARTGRA